MGKPGYIYFNDENYENLQKVENKSKLINDLLSEHFNKLDITKMNLAQLQKLQRLKQLKEEMEEVSKWGENDEDNHTERMARRV